MTWKIVHTLEQPLDPAWEQLLAPLGEKVHPYRKQGFLLSREALRLCLKERGESPFVQDLNLKNYGELISYKKYTISLSHTLNMGAAYIEESSQYRSIGIDIESKLRQVSPAVREKVSHAKDWAYSDIEFWCAKEAAFKALMNTKQFSHPQNFSDIILGKSNWVHATSKIEGGHSIEEHGELIVARAWIRP